MIGNDVVDLAAAAEQSNWRRKGFLDKVFSTEEQEIIHSAADTNRTVWLLWSMKEAAYKAHQREYFLPRKLNWWDYNCHVDMASGTEASGVVKIGENFYFTSSEITESFIYTSAKKQKTSVVKNAVSKSSSEEMKRRLLEQLSTELNLPKQSLAIVKNQHGVPNITYRNHHFIDLVSFSDHGRFSAYSVSLMNCEMAVKHY